MLPLLPHLPIALNGRVNIGPVTVHYARLGADVVRYSFIAVDSHHLLLAGLPAHLAPFFPFKKLFSQRRCSPAIGLPSGFDFENCTLILSATPCCGAVERVTESGQTGVGVCAVRPVLLERVERGLRARRWVDRKNRASVRGPPELRRAEQRAVDVNQASVGIGPVCAVFLECVQDRLFACAGGDRKYYAATGSIITTGSAATTASSRAVQRAIEIYQAAERFAAVCTNPE